VNRFNKKAVPFVSIDNKKCFYRTAGSANSGDTAVICIHGSGGDSAVWRLQEAWPGRQNLFLPDLPGHGSSEGPGLAAARDYAAWLDGFTAAVHPRPFFLAGFSLGGIIAQTYALAHPEKVRGLILISTGMRVRIAPEFAALVRNDFAKAVKASCDNAYASAVPEALYHEGFDMLLQNGPEIYYKDIMICDTFDSSTWMQRITCPALVVCGSRDGITPPALSRELAERLPHSRLQVVADAGHMVMQEQPVEFNRLVSSFIERAIREE
jgi:pimeloyl-ACP methyl ester carboxylesterase